MQLRVASARGRSRSGRDDRSGRSRSSRRARRTTRLPARALRPREHGAGGLEHGPRPPARDDARPDRGARPPARGPRRPVLALLAPLWMSGPSPLALALVADRRSWRSGALPGVLARLAGTRLGAARRRCSRSRTSRTRGSAMSASDAIHPVTFAIPFLLFCVWFLDTRPARPVRGVRAARRWRRASSMGLPIAALGDLVRARRGRRRAGGAVIAAAVLAWTLVAVYVVVPAFAGGPSVFYGVLRPASAARRGVVLETRLDRSAGRRLGALVERTTSSTSSGSRLRCSCCSSSRPGLPLSLCRSSSRTCSSDFRCDDRSRATTASRRSCRSSSPRPCWASRGSRARDVRSRLCRGARRARRRSRSSSGRGRARSGSKPLGAAEDASPPHVAALDRASRSFPRMRRSSATNTLGRASRRRGATSYSRPDARPRGVGRRRSRATRGSRARGRRSSRTIPRSSSASCNGCSASRTGDRSSTRPGSSSSGGLRVSTTCGLSRSTPSGASTPRSAMRARARYVLVVWAAMTAWSGALFATVRADYSSYRLGRFDLGNMIQAVWSTAHGRVARDTRRIYGRAGQRLGSHVDPDPRPVRAALDSGPSPLTLAPSRSSSSRSARFPSSGSPAPPRLRALAVVLAFAYLAYPWLAGRALDRDPSR